MTHDAATGKTTFQGSSTLSPVILEQVLNFKYLGVPLGCSPISLFKSFNDQVKKKARNYLSSVLSLVKTGPDRSDMAYTLWSTCALPSILYGAEVLPLLQSTILEVERCQTIVGKFILQLPTNSANVSSHIDAGLKPVWSVIAEKSSCTPTHPSPTLLQIRIINPNMELTPTTYIQLAGAGSILELITKVYQPCL